MIVTGRQPSEQEVDHMIETGESETIFQKAIQEQGRGHVSPACPAALYLPLLVLCLIPTSSNTPDTACKSAFASVYISP